MQPTPLRRFVVTNRPMLLVLFLAISQASLFCQQGQTLDLAQRVERQRAVEEVYWRHRIWPNQNPNAKPPLDEVISPEQLQAKAEDSARLSNALEKIWHAPISGQQLLAEVVRIAENTKQP